MLGDNEHHVTVAALLVVLRGTWDDGSGRSVDTRQNERGWMRLSTVAAVHVPPWPRLSDPAMSIDLAHVLLMAL
jgi:hypothetical protein